MQRSSIPVGVALGAVTSLAVMALLYLGRQVAGLPLVPFDLFDWLTRTLPGALITLFIDSMVRAIQLLGLGDIDSVAKAVEQLTALALFAIGGALFGGLLAGILSRGERSGWRTGLAGGAILLLMIAALEIERGLGSMPALPLLWLAVLTLGWGGLLGYWLSAPGATGQAAAMEAGYQPARRTALVRIIGGSIALALVASGAGRLLEGQRRSTGAGQTIPNLEAAPTPPTGRIEPAHGTRPEVTSNRDFYRIDIDLRPPVIAGDSWALAVEGLFDRPRRLTLADLMAHPAVTQPITLSCISNPIGGDLIGTSYWTGVRLADLLKELGMRREASELRLEAADGFFESVTMADLTDPRTLLVYGMNGETLPVEHGFPLRVYIPNRYGMKQPKWITRMEATSRSEAGYWVARGWSREARPQILSIIDRVAADQMADGKVPIGGIAWAGDRGIQKVEIQVDGGQWQEAILRVPPLSSLTWVQWRYDWPATPGEHTFRVRATDGTGALQDERESPPEPNGATGYHTLIQTVR